MLRARKGCEQQKDAWKLHKEIIIRGAVPFIPPELRPVLIAIAHEAHPGQNARETAARCMMAWWPDITRDVRPYVSSFKKWQ